MEDIIRKPTKDLTVPKNDVIRRPQTTPEQYLAPTRDDDGDRIGKNPFFEKPRKKNLEQQKGRGAGKGVLFALLFALLLTAGFFLANYFAMATIEVTPITRGVQIDNKFTATVDENEDELVFHFTSLTEEKAKEVPATIEKKIQKKASGVVTIYNKYSADSQRLIKNTRLEDDVTHKIFRIDESVVVPGAKVSGGKVTNPGAIEVVVYADTVGKDYNIGNTNFTIPGFKGDPRYTKFTASSKPYSPITGGFSEVKKVPSDEAIVLAQEELKQDLKKIAVEKARAQIPTEVSFFPGSMIVRFEEVPQNFDHPSTVSMRATVSVFFFDTAELTKKIAELLPLEDRENPFVITNISALDFKFVEEVNNIILSDLETIRFHLTGKADFVGKIDSKKISEDFAGKNKKDINEITKKQINIGGVNVIIRPIWKKAFPTDPAKIIVKIITK
ncbi:MAG: hypothetical protein WAV98_01415 [Minisyncoccia bacterium]